MLFGLEALARPYINSGMPKFIHLQVLKTPAGGRKARPYETLTNLGSRGGVYPRPDKTGHCSNLLIGIAHFR
jgi:hypothetical protein